MEFGGNVMRRMRTRRHLLTGLATPLILSAMILIVPKPGSSKPLPQQSDNTKMNKGDATSDATTADQQKMNAGDRAITQKIRAEIMKDKSLSTYAHNVKIITQDGKVTLKGPVRTSDEKATIEAKAAAIAGSDNVTSQIQIAPPKS
jgi:hyperosmotically inducible protein